MHRGMPLDADAVNLCICIERYSNQSISLLDSISKSMIWYKAGGNSSTTGQNGICFC